MTARAASGGALLDRFHLIIPGIGMEEVLDRFYLIIPGIGIFSPERRVLELMLPFHRLYQACSGPRLCEFPVVSFQLAGSRKICISFGHVEVEIGKTES